MNLTAHQVEKRYDRFASWFDLLEGPAERLFFAEWRKNLWKGLSGNILEVGVGTGKNIPSYPDAVNIMGIDISERMLQRAREKAKKLGKKVKLSKMDVENLSSFKDDQFDYVIGTFVFCSVPNPIKALTEIRRVLKDSGKLLLLEHVLSKHRLLAFLEHLHNPFTRALLGVNVNRDTLSNIRKAGFQIVTDEHLAFSDIFRKFIGTKQRGIKK